MARPPGPGCPLDCPDRGHCHARRQQTPTDEPRLCRNRKGYGTDHPGLGRCKHHGGSTPIGRRSALRVNEREKAEEAVVTYGLPRDVDPWTALLEEVSRAAGVVRYIGQRVAELEAEDVTFGLVEVSERTGFEPGTTTTRKAHENIWSQLYFRERKHLAAVSRDAIVAGVAERQVRIAEEQGHLFAEIIRSILGDLGVERSPEVDQVVHRHLSVVA